MPRHWRPPRRMPILSGPTRTATRPLSSSGYASAGQGTGTTRPVEPPASPSASPPYFQTPRDSYSAASSPTYSDTSRDSYSTASPPPASGRTFSRGSSRAADENDYGTSDRSGPARSAGGRAAAKYDSESASHAGGNYEVQPNDNYWVISQKVYGTGAYFKALAEHNRGKVAERDKLRVGDTISTPTIAQMEQNYPDLCPKPSRRETVRNRATLASAHGGVRRRSDL